MRHRVADLVAQSLLAHGCDRTFNVPGESFLALLDALRDTPSIDVVTCRHEGSAALAAVADAKLTGHAGVVMVSRGPGLANAMLGLHVAQQDAVPLVVLMGQVENSHLGRDAVQELSPGGLTGLVKWSGRIDTPDKAAELMARAFSEARGATPGAVVVELPEDVLMAEAGDATARVHGLALASACTEDIERTLGLLGAAQRPVIIAGGECRDDRFRADLVRTAERWNAPVVVTNKQQDLFPNDHPLWLGHMGFFGSPEHRAVIDDADLVLAIGTRLGDLTTHGYSLRLGRNGQRLVHVYVDARGIGRHYEATLAVVSSAGAFARQLVSQAPRGTPPTRDAWLSRAGLALQATQGWSAAAVPLQDVLGHAVQAAAARLPLDGVVTCDSGNFAGWVHRIFRLRPGQRMLSTSCGAMGMGVPAGVAAAMRHPGRMVLSFCGDGGFLMTGTEFITATSRRLPLKVFVSNNESYGTIRSHQERHYPARVHGTTLENPDFVAFGRAFGAYACRIDNAANADALVESALAHPGPALIEICSDVGFSLADSLARQQA